MKRLEGRKHGLDVVIAVEQSRRFFEPFVPHLGPEDGRTNELLTDEHSLVDERRAVLPHLGDDAHRSRPPRSAWVLGRHGERIDQSLRVRAADVAENDLNEPSDVVARRVDSGNELRRR